MCASHRMLHLLLESNASRPPIDTTSPLNQGFSGPSQAEIFTRLARLERNTQSFAHAC
jgi:hypothetical protein